MNKQRINELVICFKETNDRLILDEIANETVKLVYFFGKSYKQIPKSELNSIFGIALMKATKNWSNDKNTSFTSYLSQIIINELKMFIRGNQKKFENKICNEQGDFTLSMFIESDGVEALLGCEYKIIIENVLTNFTKEKTRQALRMYVDGYMIEDIVSTLKIGRTNFFYDLKTFKELLKEELK